MSAVLKTPQPSHHDYLVRAEDSSVLFVPITSPPDIKNFFLLKTCEQFTFNKEEKKFMPGQAKGILYVKRDDKMRALEAFTAKSLDALLDKIAKRIRIHYLRAS